MQSVLHQIGNEIGERPVALNVTPDDCWFFGKFKIPTQKNVVYTAANLKST